MKLEEIKEIACQYSIKSGKTRKPELIRAIQKAEGNEPCFDTDNAALCGQKSCLWRQDCV